MSAFITEFISCAQRSKAFVEVHARNFTGINRCVVINPVNATGDPGSSLTHLLVTFLTLTTAKQQSVSGRSENVKAHDLAMDLCFVVDGSGVIDDQGPGNFRKCMEFIKGILHSFPVHKGQVHAGLVTYGEDAIVNINFDTFGDQDSIDSIIDSVHYSGTDSHTGNALLTAMSDVFPHSGRHNVPHVLVLIVGSSSLDAVDSVAEELKASGVTIFCVGVGRRYDQSQLDMIASSPLNTHVLTTEFDTLGDIVPILVWRINSVFGTYSRKPTQAPLPGLTEEGGIVEAKMDLAFLVDGSSTVGEENYRSSLDFVKVINEAFWTRFNSVRIGLIVFGASVKLVFDFENSYGDTNTLNNVVDGASFPGGRTMAGKALKLTTGLLFGSKHHDSYRRVLVVIIGSTSEDDVFVGSELLMANGVTIFCMGVGNQYERTQLEGIVSVKFFQNVLTADSYVDLASLTQSLIDKIEKARTTYIPPKKSQTGNPISPGTLQPGVAGQEPHPSTNMVKPGAGASTVAQTGSHPQQPAGIPTRQPQQNIIRPGQLPSQIVSRPGSPGASVPTKIVFQPTRTTGQIPQPSSNRIQPGPGTNTVLPSGVPPHQPASIPVGKPQPNVNKPGRVPGQIAPRPGPPGASVPTHVGSSTIRPSGQVTQPSMNEMQPGAGASKVSPSAPIPTQPTGIPSGQPRPNANRPGQSPGHVPPRPGSSSESTPTHVGSKPTRPNGQVLQPSRNTMQPAAKTGKVSPPAPIPTQTAGIPSGQPRPNVNRPEKAPGQISSKPGASLPGQSKRPTGQIPGGTKPVIITGAQGITKVTKPAGATPLGKTGPGLALPGGNKTKSIHAVSRLPNILTSADEKLDLTFLLNGSTDMSETGFGAAVSFVRKVYSNFPIGQDATHVGLVLYGKENRIIFNLIEYTDKDSIDIRLLRLMYPAFDRNMLGKGLVMAKNVFDVSARPGFNHVLVVIATGRSNDDVKGPARLLRDKSVIIFCVGIGNNADMSQLRDIASFPEEEHLLKTTSDHIEKVLTPMVQNIRKDITRPAAAMGPVGVRMELGFLLDVSANNFQPDEFSNVLNFIKTIYGSYEVGQDKTRVGVLTYNGRPHLAISLDQYASLESLDTAVEQIALSSILGPPLLGQALTAAKTKLLYGKTRPETPKILVVVIGGQSGDDVAVSSAELKKLNVTIFAIGVGDNIDQNQLNVIATNPASEHVVLAMLSHRNTAGDNLASRIAKTVRVDLGFLVDGSRNLQESDFTQSLEMVRYVYSTFPISSENVLVGLGVISSHPEIIFGFDKYVTKPSLDMAVRSVKYPGPSQDMNIGLSLGILKEMLFGKSSRKRVRQVLVMLLSGKSQDDIIEPAQRLRDSGIEIFCLGVGPNINTQELFELASLPSEGHLLMGNKSTFSIVVRDLIEKLQITTVAVDQKVPLGPPQPDQRREVAIDLGILIEGSDNTKLSDFEQIKQIAKSIYYSFSVSQIGTHVAVAVFAEITQIIFNLNKHYEHQGMDIDLDAAPYLSGRSRTGNAIRKAKTEIFDQNSRENVPKVLITVLTGKPDDDLAGPTDALKKSCVLMFALGLTPSYSPQHITQASGEPQFEYVLTSETFPDPVSIAQKITDKVNKVVAVAESRVKSCVQSKGYETKQAMDVVFILDGCRNILNENFTQELKLVRSVARSISVAPGNLRVAIITVSNGAKVTRDLENSPLNVKPTSTRGADLGRLCLFGQALKGAASLLKAKGLKGVPQFVVVLMAGSSDDELSQPAKDLRDSGVIVHAVSLGNAVQYSTVSNLTSAPGEEFYVSATDFPYTESAEKTIVDKLTRVLKIVNSLVCPTRKPLPEECANSMTTPSPSNAGVPIPSSRQENRTKTEVMDLVFLVDGSDLVNESLFRTLLDIVEKTYQRFLLSKESTHVAIVVYGSNLKVITNLQNYNTASSNVALRSASKPGGINLAGKALNEVKDNIFTATGRPRESGVSRVLVHIMCGRSRDDVIQPATSLREEGVRIIAAGACTGDNKNDLCNIGSAPRCKNSVLIQVFKPPEIPAKELANRITEGREMPRPTQGLFHSITSWVFPHRPMAEVVAPLVPSLIPINPQALRPPDNVWNYGIPIRQGPVLLDPYAAGGNSMLYRMPICVDYDSACSGFGASGFCNGPVIGYTTEYLMKMCKKSCGFCKADKDVTNESVWVRRGHIPKPTQDSVKLPHNKQTIRDAIALKKSKQNQRKPGNS